MNSNEYQLHFFLGSLIRQLRKQHGLSAQELANRIGQKSGSYILRLERGEVSPIIYTIYRIAAVFDMDGKELIRQAEVRMKNSPSI